MRASLELIVLYALSALFFAANPVAAQDRSEYRVASSSPTIPAQQTKKFSLILFYKENDAATQQMTADLKAALATRSDRVEWSSIDVNDASQRAIIDRYHVDRAPMPMVLCVAANGAITGAIPRKFSEEALERVLVTHAMTEATKALQERKIVVIHLTPDGRTVLPMGANAFIADPMFKERTVVVNLLASDPAEARFLKEMEIKPETVTDSNVVILAPPGVLVGKFAANATADQIAESLHAAGKCCNDPNCKYNQKGNK